MSRKVREANRNVSKNHKNNRDSIKKNNITQNKKNHHSQEKELEQTTRIRIDQDRLEDYESLDTSFLEGRLQKKARNNRSFKEKLLNNSKKNHTILKRILLLSFLASIILLLISIIPSLSFNNNHSNKEGNISTEEEKTKKKYDIDDNYLFVGDYHTVGLEQDILPNFVKVCDDNYQTKDILDDMKHMIYQYNPSIIFLQIGMNDLREGVGEEELVSNYYEIVDKIQNNRPYAKIVVESLYPVNTDIEDYDSEFFKESVSIDDISSINSKIIKMVKEKNIEYLNIYKELSDEKKLKEQYTEDGIHLNDKGYKKIISLIQNKIEVLS